MNSSPETQKFVLEPYDTKRLAALCGRLDEHLRQIELEKALLQLRSGADPEQVLSRMSRTLMNKVMHKPTAAIKRAAEKGQIDQIEWAQQLLGIDPPNKPD